MEFLDGKPPFHHSQLGVETYGARDKSGDELSLDELIEVCEPLGEDHTEFMRGLDYEEAIGYLYGSLTQEGIDADAFFELTGIAGSGTE